LHPEEAKELIRAAATRAIEGVVSAALPQISLPATLEVLFLTGDMAEMATWIKGVTRVDVRTVTMTDDDPIRLFQTFVTVVQLTRAIVE
ncbi:MAG: M55 family metallopeptidase, partial [Janthinobacterium lividum]